MFEVGDLVQLPDENTGAFDHDDYGIVFKVEIAGKDFDELIHYYIHWAIDQAATIEDDIWVHENLILIARA